MSELIQVAGCRNGSCPKIFVAGDRAIVQGTSRPKGRLDVPPGEALVEIPLDVLREALGEVA